MFILHTLILWNLIGFKVIISFGLGSWSWFSLQGFSGVFRRVVSSEHF